LVPQALPAGEEVSRETGRKAPPCSQGRPQGSHGDKVMGEEGKK
jgi:hypothetical protein